MLRYNISALLSYSSSLTLSSPILPSSVDMIQCVKADRSCLVRQNTDYYFCAKRPRMLLRVSKIICGACVQEHRNSSHPHRMLIGQIGRLGNDPVERHLCAEEYRLCDRICRLGEAVQLRKLSSCTIWNVCGTEVTSCTSLLLPVNSYCSVLEYCNLKGDPWKVDSYWLTAELTNQIMCDDSIVFEKGIKCSKFYLHFYVFHVRALRDVYT
jgi:hypothetical protein